MIAGVILAAGRATRFGGPKVLAPLGGVAVVRHVADRLRAAGVAPLVVVVGGGDVEAGVVDALDGCDAATVRNLRPDDGVSASLRVGVDALPEEIGAFVIALGDQPLIEVDLVRQLVRTWQESNAAAVVPVYRDGRGNPVLFDATMRRLLRTLSGDVGARDLLLAMADRVVHVTVDHDAPRDVDTPDDLRALGG